jgi:hypothetical protein
MELFPLNFLHRCSAKTKNNSIKVITEAAAEYIAKQL